MFAWKSFLKHSQPAQESESTTSPNKPVLTLRHKAPPQSQSAFVSLPVEIQLSIFEILDHSTSVCLGLTCKTFYQIHFTLRPRVSLITCQCAPPYPSTPHLNGLCISSFPLWELLHEWMGKDLTYRWKDNIFLTDEQFIEREEKRMRKQEVMRRKREEREKRSKQRRWWGPGPAY
jgi:hypothetical protein